MNYCDGWCCWCRCVCYFCASLLSVLVWGLFVVLILFSFGIVLPRATSNRRLWTVGKEFALSADSRPTIATSSLPFLWKDSTISSMCCVDTLLVCGLTTSGNRDTARWSRVFCNLCFCSCGDCWCAPQLISMACCVDYLKTALQIRFVIYFWVCSVVFQIGGWVFFLFCIRWSFMIGDEIDYYKIDANDLKIQITDV